MEDFTHPLPDMVYCGACYALHRKSEARRKSTQGHGICIMEPKVHSGKKKDGTRKTC